MTPTEFLTHLQATLGADFTKEQSAKLKRNYDKVATGDGIPNWAKGLADQYISDLGKISLSTDREFVIAADIIADLDMTLGQVRISIEGSVENLARLIGAELSLSISGPAIENVTDTFGLPPFAEGEFSVDGRIVKLDAGSQLRLEGNIGAIDMVASGTVDSLIKFRTAQLDFNVSGPDTQYVAEVFGVAGAPAVPFLISGDVNKQDSRVVFSGTRVQLGENILGFDGWLDFRGGVPDGDLTIEASGPDFSVVGPFAGVEGMPAETFEISGRVQKQGKSVRFDDLKAVIGQNRIQAHGAIGEEGSPDTQIEFNATGPDISILGPITGLQGIQPRAFDISAIVKPDKIGIRVENATGDFGEIQVAVDGVVATAKGMQGTDLRLHANGTDLRDIALLAGVPMLPDGPFDVGVRARFSRNGLRLSEGSVSVAEINGTISGSVLLGADAGDFAFDLSVNGPDLADALEFDWLDRLSGEPFSLQGRLEHQSGEFKFHSVNASISDFEINVDGDLVIDNMTGEIRLQATAPDAEELRKLIDVAYLPEGAVSVRGRVEKQEDELEFTDVMASIGAYSFHVDGALSMNPLSNRSDLRFSGSGPELREIGLIFDSDDLPAKAFSMIGEVNGIPIGFALERFVAKIGDNNIEGGFTADLRDKPEVTGTLSSSYVDLASRPGGAGNDLRHDQGHRRVDDQRLYPKKFYRRPRGAVADGDHPPRPAQLGRIRVRQRRFPGTPGGRGIRAARGHGDENDGHRVPGCRCRTCRAVRCRRRRYRPGPGRRASE